MTKPTPWPDFWTARVVQMEGGIWVDRVVLTEREYEPVRTAVNAHDALVAVARAVTKYRALMRDPHPGLATWCEFKRQREAEIDAALSALPKDLLTRKEE